MAFTLAQDRHWALAALSLCASLTCIPFAAFDIPLQERIEGCFVMPFVLAGLSGFVFLYFQMFHFAWFEATFNDKSSEPLGLIVSAFTGITVGGYPGWRVICVIPGTIHQRRRRAEVADHSAEQRRQPERCILATQDGQA